LAKGFANAKHKVDIANIKGTGIQGSVTKSDVEKYLESAPKESVQPQQGQQQVQAPAAGKVAATPVAPASKPGVTAGVEPNPYQDIEVSNIRRVIASRLLESKTTIPHYYLSMKVTMDSALAYQNVIDSVGSERNSIRSQR
jgi:pyruvate dehydrogenase E2 component (dihydrolipoamide acetyltransferase)